MIKIIFDMKIEKFDSLNEWNLFNNSEPKADENTINLVTSRVSELMSKPPRSIYKWSENVYICDIKYGIQIMYYKDCDPSTKIPESRRHKDWWDKKWLYKYDLIDIIDGDNEITMRSNGDIYSVPNRISVTYSNKKPYKFNNINLYNKVLDYINLNKANEKLVIKKFGNFFKS